MSYYAVVWIDHREAKVFQLGIESYVMQDFKAHPRVPHRGPLEHKPGHRIGLDPGLCQKVADALHEPQAVLVTGPSTAKNELMRYLQEHAARIAAKVVAVESSDHPSDAQVVAHGRRFFRVARSMGA